MTNFFTRLFMAACALSATVLPAQSRTDLPVEVTINNAGAVFTGAMSPDRRFLVTTEHGNQSLVVWNREGKKIRTIAVGYDANRVKFSGEPNVVVASGIRGVFSYDIESGKMVRRFIGPRGNVWDFDLSPDRSRLIAAFDDKTGTAKLFDVGTGQELGSFLVGRSPGCIRFIPGRNRFAVLADKKIRIWDIPQKKEIRTIPAETFSCAVSPDGKWIAGTDRASVSVWDIETGKLVRQFAEQSFAPVLQFSKSGALALAYRNLIVWDVNTGRELVRSGSLMLDGNSLSLASADFSSDGKTVFVLGEGFHVHDIGAQMPSESIRLGLQKEEKYITSVVTVDPLVKDLIDRGPSLRVRLDAKRMLPSSRGEPPSDQRHIDPALLAKVQRDKPMELFSHFLSLDSKLLVVQTGEDPFGDRRSTEGELIAWDVPSQTELARVAHKDLLDAIISADGSSVAFIDDEGVKLWRPRLNSIKLVLANKITQNRYAFANDGRWLLVAGDRKTLSVFDVDSGNLLTAFETGDTGWFGASNDGNFVALTAPGRGAIEIWNLRNGTHVLTLEQTTGLPSDLRFSRDGRFVVARSPIGQVWDARTGKLLVTAASFGNDEWVTVTREGFFSASQNGAVAKKLNVVRGLDVYTIGQVYQALHRPDLVREKLAGDPKGKVREAAAKLDLAKVLDSGKSPRVRIVAPQAGSVVSDEELSAEASITDEGGGIGKVEFRVNGTTFGIETEGAGGTSVGRAVNVRRTLSLVPGENRIEVVAYNAQGLIASDPAELVVNLQERGTRMPPRLYVLAVGVNDYWDSRLKLAFAVSDAQALGDALKKAGENLYESVDVTMLLDGQVTGPQVDRAFSDLGGKVRPQDVFVFFLSAHGKTIDGRFYFIPQDFRYTGEESLTTKTIGQDQLQGWLARIKARKSVLLLDACESGSLAGDRPSTRGVEELTAIDRLTQAMGRTVLTATTDDKPAVEGVGGHGVFTYALLSALGEAQSDNDGLIGVAELASFVDRRVPELSYDAFKIRQVPQMKIVGSNFPLARKLAVLVGSTAGPGAALPTRPTHVVIAPTPVYQEANDSAPMVIGLAPGTQVRLIETADGWMLLAREGRRLGYVKEDHKALVGVQ